MYFMLFFIAAVIALAAYIMILHNKAIPAQNIAHANWYNIDALLKRRMNLIPHLLEAAKGYMQYEREMITILNKLRSHMRQYGSQNNIKSRIEVEHELSVALDKLLTAAQKYPDLKTNIPFLNSQKMLSHLNEELEKTSTGYNAAASEINALLKFAPNKFIMQFFGVVQLDYF